MKNKTGVFVVLDTETFEQAARQDMKDEADGTKFRIYSLDKKIIESLQILNGEVIPWEVIVHE